MAASITLIKNFTYRGAREEFSNTYHLDGTPVDNTAWRALSDAIWALEAAVLSTDAQLRHAYGHTSDDTPAVWSHDYSADAGGGPMGTFPTTGTAAAPGDAAMWTRWDTGRLSSSGKKIYLRKYFHTVLLNSTGGDAIKTAQATALVTFGSSMLTLASGGVHFAGVDGVRPPGPAAGSTYATTRTLKRRGKRPGS